MDIIKKGNQVAEKDPVNMKNALAVLKREIRKPYEETKTGEMYALIRYSLGLTQHEFAELMGTSVKTISRWENKETKPILTADQFHALAYELKKKGIDILNIKHVKLLVDTNDLKIINSFAFGAA